MAELNDLLACGCVSCRTRHRELTSLFGPQQGPRTIKRRAEALLARFLITEQKLDWKRNGAINVRGSAFGLYRLIPGNAVITQHGSLVNIWPVGLTVPADWVLALMLYIGADELNVIAQGCTDRDYDGLRDLITDYGGKI